MNAIEIRNLTKLYSGRRVVDGLNLDVGRGELFALLGVNGAGKSSTISMLAGILAPDGGDARVMGNSLRRDVEGVKRVTNLSPQESAVAPKLTVAENLEFVAEIYGLRRSEARQRAWQSMVDLDLLDVRDQRAATLSGGMMRRLSIAMALITRPDVLFLDEPTLGLDVLARRELWKLLHKLHGGVTILLTTHYMEEAEALADRIGILQRGRLIAVGTAEELMARAGVRNFEQAFVALAGGEGEMA